MNQQRIRVEMVGTEGVPVAVIDDFSPDPEALVEEAVRLTYQPLGAFYPGPRAPVGPAYFKGLNSVIAAVAKQVFGAADRIVCDRALYAISTTPPGDLSLAQRIPHIDNTEPGKLAIVHYLSRTDLGGTAFYRHRSTDFERITPDRHRAYLDALRADITAHGEPPAAYIEGDTALFEQTAAFEPAFNRALIYPGNLLHCACLAGRALSPDPRVGRLTVASFLTTT